MRLITLIIYFLFASSAMAQEVITYVYKDTDGTSKKVEAVLRVPPKPAVKNAVIILHTAGGWSGGSTTQYGDFFEKQNFITLEPRMFSVRSETPWRHLSQVYGALQYLKSRPDVNKNGISIVGLSYGASLSIYAMTKWANENFNNNETSFKSAFVLYPTCFFHENIMKKDDKTISRMKNFGFPDNFQDSWQGIPLRIYAGGNDDYENREKQPCLAWVNLIADDSQKKMTSIVDYPEATHRWDAGKNQSFPDPLGCKWRGCTINTVDDPALTEKVKVDILERIKN